MTKPSITIRRGVPGDLAELQRLNQGLFDYEHANGYYPGGSYNLSWPTSPAGTAYFKGHLADDPAKVTFLAQVNDRLIGFITARYSDYPYRVPSTIGELEIMFVEEAYRSQGAGTRLVETLKAWATGHNVGHLRVGAFAANQKALDFYRREGFVDLELFLEMPLG